MSHACKVLEENKKLTFAYHNMQSRKEVSWNVQKQVLTIRKYHYSVKCSQTAKQIMLFKYGIKEIKLRKTSFGSMKNISRNYSFFLLNYIEILSCSCICFIFVCSSTVLYAIARLLPSAEKRISRHYLATYKVVWIFCQILC